MTTAAEVVARLEARGGRLEALADAVAVTPRSALTDADRQAIRRHKADVLAILRGRALGTDWARVSLRQLDKVLEVAVPWSDISLVIAPGCRIARALRATDPMPGRVWCVCEVLDLLLLGVKPENARNVADARLIFAAELCHIRPKENA